MDNLELQKKIELHIKNAKAELLQVQHQLSLLKVDANLLDKPSIGLLTEKKRLQNREDKLVEFLKKRLAQWSTLSGKTKFEEDGQEETESEAEIVED